MTPSLQQMISHFEDKTMKPKKVPRQRPLFKPLKRIKVNYSPDTKRLFVSVYFGSTTDFSRPRFSIKEAA